MKKIFMLGVLVISMMAFSINIHATDITDAGMVGNITGVEVVNTSSGTEITLTQDVNLGDNYLNVISGTHVIDLNGYTLSGINNVVVYIDGDNVSLTINDTSSSKTGKIICTKEDNSSAQVGIQLNNGSLTINGGTFEGENYGAYISDNAIINGGTFGSDDNGIGMTITKSTTINNGIFKGTVGLAFKGVVTSDTLTINNGTFGNENSTNGIRLESGKVIINNATLNTRTDKGIGLGITVYGSNNIDVKIENINSTGGLAGLVIDSQRESNDNIININGGTFSGKMYGSAIGENMIPYTKISGGRFMSTNSDENNNFGGIVIMKEQTTTGSQNSSFESAYTLKSLLKSGYNYSNRTFNEKTRVDTLENMVATITFSGTNKDVFVAQERTITIKDRILNGTVTAPKMAVVGEEVTLRVTPDHGYKLKTISAKDKFDEMPVTITNNKFIMPNYNVFVETEFEKIEYEITKGNGQKYTIGKKENAVFTIDADKSLFNKVYLNDKELDSKHYEVTEGSTIITLKQDYLDTLIAGTYNLKTTFTDGGEANTTFVIAKAEVIENNEPNPKTGDGIIYLILIGSVSLIGFLLSSIYIKKESVKNFV